MKSVSFKDACMVIENELKKGTNVSIAGFTKQELDLLRKFYKVTIEPFGYAKFEKKEEVK